MPKVKSLLHHGCEGKGTAVVGWAGGAMPRCGHELSLTVLDGGSIEAYIWPDKNSAKTVNTKQCVTKLQIHRHHIPVISFRTSSTSTRQGKFHYLSLLWLVRGVGHTTPCASCSDGYHGRPLESATSLPPGEPPSDRSHCASFAVLDLQTVEGQLGDLGRPSL